MRITMDRQNSKIENLHAEESASKVTCACDPTEKVVIIVHKRNLICVEVPIICRIGGIHTNNNMFLANTLLWKSSQYEITDFSNQINHWLSFVADLLETCLPKCYTIIVFNSSRNEVFLIRN
ncbi:uncharacterized protein LOC142221472 [Haematobia irritans]|uniref:uncharacterized protein LOC142221472 n=1 Tax=Haematobia irritans TaxID=7368 RepID=UPI003F50266A